MVGSIQCLELKTTERGTIKSWAMARVPYLEAIIGELWDLVNVKVRPALLCVCAFLYFRIT